MRLHTMAGGLLIAAGSLAVPAAGLAQDAAKGAALLADARKAVGGDDKLAAVKRLQVSGASKRVAGNQTLEGDITLYVEAPDKYRMTEDIGLPGGAINITRTQVLNGTEVWDENEGGGFPGGGFRGGGGRGGFGGGGRAGGGLAGALGGDQAQAGRGQIDPERVKEAQRRTRQADLARYLLVMLLTTSDAVTWVGTAESPDGNADVLEIKPQDGVATRLFLDSSTHMPLMVTWDGPAARNFGGGRGGRGRGGDAAAPAPPAPAPEAEGTPATPPQGRRGAPGGNAGGNAGGAPGGAAAPTTFEMHLADYKTVNGIKLPHLLTRGVNGQTQEEIAVKSYKINPNFKSSTFIQSK